MTDAALTHDRTAILSIGDELLIGRLRDGNAAWLSDRLARLGVKVVEHAAVGDDREAIEQAILRLAASAPLLICTGGLGPTADDLTRHALAGALGDELIEDAEALEHLKRRYAHRSARALEDNRMQAHRPASARMLDNELGTAPGLAARVSSVSAAADVFCLPGPPNEAERMFERCVRPSLCPPGDRAVVVRDLRLFGLPEAEVARRLGEMFPESPAVKAITLADASTVTVRLRVAGDDDAARQSLDRAESVLRSALGAYVFGLGEPTLAEVVVALLKERGERLVVAESCTGGLVAQMLTSVAGASDVFLGGWVAYTNELKCSQLGVTRESLEQIGAVSDVVAQEMARGALAAATNAGLAAEHALAITGVAGPGGGSAEKPVGTVYIARASLDARTDARRFLFPGDREMVRERSALSALARLRLHLIGADSTRLLWDALPPSDA